MALTAQAAFASLKATFIASRPVRHVHLNLSLRRVTVTWEGDRAFSDVVARTIDNAGYRAIPFSAESIGDLDREKSESLLKALAVTAFSSTNVMMLSIAVWSGTGSDMEPATRGLLQMLSALIACPAIVYGASTFFNVRDTSRAQSRDKYRCPHLHRYSFDHGLKSSRDAAWR